MPVRLITNTQPIATLNSLNAKRDELMSHRNELIAKIKIVKNCLSKPQAYVQAVERNISAGRKLLKNLDSIAVKQGNDASVRLKGNKFKCGQSSSFIKNLVNGSRYELEREAAAKKLNAQEQSISVSKAKSLIDKEIQASKKRLEPVLVEVEHFTKQLNDFEEMIDDTDEKLRLVNKKEVEIKKSTQQERRRIEMFSAIYQTNVGSAALNSVARKNFGFSVPQGKLEGSNIVAEYERVHGPDIFTHGNKELPSLIKAQCDDLSELVDTATETWYTPSDKNITTFRGQGMTEKGFTTLLNEFELDKKNHHKTVYELGQFFSSSSSLNTAREFASSSPDEVKVIFKIKGNSSQGLLLPEGLPYKTSEKVKLYSPLANFCVTDIYEDKHGIKVELKEVSRNSKAVLLPY